MDDIKKNNCGGKFIHGKIVHQVQSSIPKDEILYDLADFFKMLGDTTRIKILQVLLISEMCVYDLASLLNVSQSALSHQLKTLRQADLVKYRKEGKSVFYSLKDGHINSIIDLGLTHIMEKFK
ncbi:MAG: winged helix-turn-helix transcriptional regulator [Spirochaetes bacterium]|nr:winged helix-turn-helix transcriptional regulator [Spirochaetota bacterium]